ncbi:MAG: putative DNA modification/repair radical SAM protein [Coriobacteriia bacterium]|nr:putative DNA modification/repair radical SAM protein [Coriobacteriia bacterium]
MDVNEKLEILTDAAKYDVACTSSGVDRASRPGMLGSASCAGICHSFAADGRCISLLKVLMTNECIYDCAYCTNRASNDRPRASFTPQELADLTIGFYRRNYIEGLFLSSGVSHSPDHATEQMCEAIMLLRETYRFRGYIHAKAIPGASPELVERLGLLVDRLSVNIELPSERSLKLLAPNKARRAILGPMAQIRDGVAQTKALARYKGAPRFAPAGQSTQMIVGATPETDHQILNLSSALYRSYDLRRVFFSAYIPVGTSEFLPQGKPAPLAREHRLYQADWLMRMYGFSVDEIVDEAHPDLDPLIDPKCQWALRHLDFFPIEVNTATLEELMRVPGIGTFGARKIVRARRAARLSYDDLKLLKIVARRAQYFITCGGKYRAGLRFDGAEIYRALTSTLSLPRRQRLDPGVTQPGLFDFDALLPVEARKALTGQF